MKNALIIIFALLSLATNAQTVIYSEDFQAGLPANYTIVDNDGLTPAAAVSEFSDAWILLADPDNTSDSIMGSTSYFDPAGTASRWLITPQITLGSYGNVLYWEARSHDPSFPDSYMILISTTDTQIASFTDTLYAYGGEHEYWSERSVNVSDSGYNNVNAHFAFVNITEDGFKLYIDDIRVEMEDPSGLNELTNDNFFHVYPNPANNVIRLEGISDDAFVTVYDAQGRLIVSAQGNLINVSSLDYGAYIVVAKQNNTSRTARFIKN